jgi:predicted ATPase/transcriptional regulator with XRE-family HTH domain
MSELFSFGTWVRRRRKALDLTREELAPRVGCAVVTIRRIESGERRPSKELAACLADALELEAEERATFVLAARREFAAAQLPAPRQGLRGASQGAANGGIPPSKPMPLSGLASTLRNRGHTNLPAQLTPLIGRTEETQQVRALLLRDDVRLVTLTGPGGIGKTRLALRVADELSSEFVDGVFLVELAPLSDPALVLPTIARVLGRYEVTTSLFDDLAHYLHEKRMLLLLDNIEHMIDAVPTLARLLAAAPKLSALATSRTTLGVPGEYEFVLPPLALPDAQTPATVEQMRGYAAVALFAQRAEAARHTFALTNAIVPIVASICRHLEGLPLAIELASASVCVLSVEQIAARLANGMQLPASTNRAAPPRHQTLEATLDWSYRLLGPQASAVLRRLAVFAGSWSLSAAEAVCAGEDVAPDLVLELLSELRSKSFLSVQVQGGEARYRMLEMVRQYARARLESAGEVEQAETNHLHFFAALIEQARPGLISGNQVAWFERLTLDLDNVRTALDRALARAIADPLPAAIIRALVMPAGLERFWSPRGYSAEGAQRIWSALALPISTDPAVAQARAMALNAASVLDMLQGNYARAWQAAEEAHALGEALDCAMIMFTALRNLGTITVLQRDLGRGNALLQRCLELGRTLGREASHGCAWALSVKGSAAYLSGDYVRASELFEECVILLRALGDANILALALRRLGQIALRNGDHGRARDLFQESMASNMSIDSPSGIAAGLIGLAGVLLMEGQAAEAVRLLGVAQTVLEERAERLMAADLEMQQRLERQAVVLLGEQRFAEALAEGRASTLDLKVEPSAEH